MKSILILLTHSFPFGEGETFLDNEIEYTKIFDEVILAPMTSNGDIRYEVKNDKINIVEVGSIMSKYERIIWYMKSLLSSDMWKEIIGLCKDKKITLKKLKFLLSTTSYAERLYKGVHRTLKKKYKKSTEIGTITIYAYWMTGAAYTALKLKENINIQHKFVFSRCHGHDIYEWRVKDNYLPYRKLYITKLDEIYPISLNGELYLNKKYNFSDKVKIKHYYLGTKDYGTTYASINKDPFVIVSCSSIIPIKRVNLIIDALEKLHNKNVKWIHIGNGEMFESIKKMSKDKLQHKIEFLLLGNLNYDEVISFYINTAVNLFLNTSESEGIPVSIMEALSFGIPVIATDVGGVAEIVHNSNNGYLLKKDFDVKYLSNLIEHIMSMPQEEYQILRQNSRKSWENDFSGDNNYYKFYSDIYMNTLMRK